MNQYVSSKWKKTAALLEHNTIREYIPKTVRMTKESLELMLEEHKMVYIKPDVGTYGGGVMRVEKLNSGAYQYQHGEDKRTFSAYRTMYRDIRSVIGKRKYLVQKGIHLLKYYGRRFDIRVMVQQNLEFNWESTGLMGRVAHPNKIVTNFHNGGTLMPVRTLMSVHLTGDQTRQFMDKLRNLGVQVAKGMHSHFFGVKEIGIDVGVDQEFKPWILEVNTRPDPYIFRRLRNKSISRKIFRYARAYGRI